MKKFVLFAAVCSTVFLITCKKESTCSTDGVTYTNTTKSIFDQHCIVCHFNNSGIGSYASYDSIKVAPYFSKIVHAIKHESGYSAMPKTGNQLDDCDIKKMEAWINSGTPR